VLRRPATIGDNAQYRTFHLGIAVLGFEIRIPCYNGKVIGEKFIGNNMVESCSGVVKKQWVLYTKTYVLFR
jgi:hypothetical protein